MDENRGVFTYLEPATGDCPDCGAAYKWVEVRTEVIDGVTVKTRTFVCGLNHLTTDPRQERQHERHSVSIMPGRVWRLGWRVS